MTSLFHFSNKKVLTTSLKNLKSCQLITSEKCNLTAKGSIFGKTWFPSYSLIGLYFQINFPIAILISLWLV